MASIAGTISDIRQMLHGTRSAKVFYTLMGWDFPVRTRGSIETVLFLGDSITQLWAVENRRLFGQGGFVNAGVGGQTSGQIRKSCRLDIIKSDPDAVHLMCGINDIAENLGPVSDRRILSNIESVIKYCQARDILILIGSILPATEIPWNSGIRPHNRIKSINKAMENLCMSRNILYVNYFSILATDTGDLRSDYSTDGLHLSQKGYDAIEPFMLDSIERTRQSRSSHRPQVG